VKKPIIDREGRLFGKISVIDLAVVLIAAVMVCALYVKNHRLDASSTAEEAKTKITFTTITANVPLHIVDALQVGDTLYDKDHASGGAIGEIKDIQILPAEAVGQTGDGAFITVGNDDARNVVLTVEGSGSISNGRYSFNRIYQLGINANRNFYTRYATLNSTQVTAIYPSGERAS